MQVLRDLDHAETAPILAAVGALQFDVFSHRLAGEFGAPAEILPAGYQAIRRTDVESLPRLRDIGGIRVLRRSDGAIVALFENRYRLARLEAGRARADPRAARRRVHPVAGRLGRRPPNRVALPYPEPMLRTLSAGWHRPARHRRHSPDSGLVGVDRSQPRHRPATSPGARARKGSASRSSARRWRCRWTTTIRPVRPIDLAVIRYPANPDDPRGGHPAQPRWAGWFGVRLRVGRRRVVGLRDGPRRVASTSSASTPAASTARAASTASTTRRSSRYLYADDTPDDACRGRRQRRPADDVRGRLPRGATATRCTCTRPRTRRGTWT